MLVQPEEEVTSAFILVASFVYRRLAQHSCTYLCMRNLQSYCISPMKVAHARADNTHGMELVALMRECCMQHAMPTWMRCQIELCAF